MCRPPSALPDGVLFAPLAVDRHLGVERMHPRAEGHVSCLAGLLQAGVRRDSTVLMALPSFETAMERALLDEARRKRKFDWQRFIIGWTGVFHVGIAFTLAAAPYQQIYNAGTAPVYVIASRYQWAAAFLIAGLLPFLLLRWQTALVQLLTWITVLPLGVVWLLAFTLAVLDGRGSAIGVVVWVALYGPPAVAGARLALGKR